VKNATKIKVKMLALCVAISMPGFAAAATQTTQTTQTQQTAPQALARMQADARALSDMTRTWPQIQAAAQSYGALAPFSAQQWAGPGPTITTQYGGVEQCHNTHWDSVTSNLITGGLNIAGDAEAETYAIQDVAVDFQEAMANFMIAQVQAGHASVMNQLDQQNGALIKSLNTLTGLLDTTSQQVGAAMNPTSTQLHPLPIHRWLAGIGNVPNLAQVQYTPGQNDGAPIGWYFQPSSALARLIDVCPTGTGSIPMLPLAAPVMAAAQQAVIDAPELASTLQPVENGSSYALPAMSFAFGSAGGGAGRPLTGVGGGYSDYQVRMSLVSALASNMQPIAGYMSPIDTPLALYKEQVAKILAIVG
jgi:hypothetical protein